MGWKTYLVMYFGTRGNKTMDEIVNIVESIGFKSALGPTDFLYDWGDKEPSKEEVFEIGNKLLKELNGSDVVFNLDTHD